MKDKILPPDYDKYSVEELTEKANKIIESLEKENDLNNSVDSYQELLKLNNIIEKKFHKNFNQTFSWYASTATSPSIYAPLMP